MSIILLLAAATMQSAPVSPDDAKDILVIGERMRRVSLVARYNRKTRTHRCVIKRTSGDPIVDAGFCEAALACARIATRQAEMDDCLRLRMAALPGLLAERRRAARAVAK